MLKETLSRDRWGAQRISKKWYFALCLESESSLVIGDSFGGNAGLVNLSRTQTKKVLVPWLTTTNHRFVFGGVSWRPKVNLPERSV